MAVLLAIAATTTGIGPAHAQVNAASPTEAPPAADTQDEDVPAPPRRVDVRPGVHDEEIRARLARILTATDWFEHPSVEVREGVVFLRGTTKREHSKKWAGDLARSTEGVTAVVNDIELLTPSALDLAPALDTARGLWRGFVGALPALVLGAVISASALAFGALLTRTLRRRLGGRVPNALLRDVFARAAGFLVFVLGLYIALQIAGLTRLAVTVVGGTGLLGLVLGIAFRDISENFLASIFLSMQRPFRTGDLVEIEGILGIVQRLTVRASVLMTLDGDHVQIPNATVYKSKIRNFTSNVNRRVDFVIGIGYDDAILEAQEVAREVLQRHPAVLKEPEPWVLVDGLQAATVDLRVYFWIDGCAHSWLKVQSSVMRLVKRAFQDAGISMPDAAREIVFPKGIPLRREELPGVGEPQRDEAPGPERGAEPVTTKAEAGLASDAETIDEQARRARTPEEGADLLADREDGRSEAPASTP